MLHLNNNGCMDVVCVSERDDSYCDVHSLSKNSYYLLKAPPPPPNIQLWIPLITNLYIDTSSKTCKVLLVCSFTHPPLLLMTSSSLDVCLSNCAKNFVSKGTVVTRKNSALIQKRKNRACIKYVLNKEQIIFRKELRFDQTARKSVFMNV